MEQPSGLTYDPPASQLLSLQQAAAYTREYYPAQSLTEGSLRVYLNKGKIRGIKLDRYWYTTAAELDRYLSQSASTPNEPQQSVTDS
ncbi:helix-turn-helix domain-containing protein [Herpetosiphon geysericola]|uniref:Helix-turn-helix domain-containing protein n=1 Tax=Herpetosiphon geysericola TaxID=70996 RepID=A0A0P6Y7K4_9CHLR|nr:helix-turn-helix domain-containing protein [Herpetosiphon geysericola]KPL88781.1 hypothetical protein SE18_08815 [Herpetosiphon geysericola]